MEYEDRTLVCEDCGNEWTFSSDEQEFFNDRGYQTPKRCKPCRQKRKTSRTGGSSGGFGERTLHTVTCSDCGEEAEVPFKPTGDRPVYCRDCYQKHR
ncbi:MAG: CxxC-x17-CxxC domain-containing protein [Candidatus Hydrothermarchaeaceae archaeon]